MRKIGETALLLALLAAVSGPAGSQTIAESASATADSSVKIEASVKAPNPATPAQATSSKPETETMVVAAGPPGDEINRNKFEAEAGPHPSRLLLRSSPTGATVLLNNLPIGKTPLLVFVAPGKYLVKMRGERDQTASETVGTLADKTQTVLLELKAKYPTSIKLH